MTFFELWNEYSSIIGIGALVLFVASAYLVVGAAVAEIRHRLAVRRHRRAFAKRERGRIVQIGHVFRDPAGNEHAYGFTVDCGGRIPAIAFGPDGEVVSAGWTEQELIEVAKRRAEFETT